MVIECLLASHHLGYIRAIKAVNAIGSDQAFLPLDDLAFFRKMIPFFLEDSILAQVVLV